MSTWVCPDCHTYNPLSSGQCMACGREHAAAPTVARPSSAPTPSPPAGPATGASLDAATDSGDGPTFPWLIVAAAVVAMLLVAGVIAIAIAKTGDRSDTTEKLRSGSSSSTVTTTSLITTAATETTVAPPIVTTPVTVAPRPTAPRATTTTLPPVVGVACPSTNSSDATVHIHTGSKLNFRDGVGSKKTLDQASDGDLIRFWARPETFDGPTLRTWVLAELPTHAGRCGYTSASNINMDSDTYFPADDEDGCDTWEGGVVAVLLCDDGNGGQAMKVIWKANGAVPDLIGPMQRDANGLATARRDADLYTLDRHELRVTRNGAELVTADIRSGE